MNTSHTKQKCEEIAACVTRSSVLLDSLLPGCHWSHCRHVRVLRQRGTYTYVSNIAVYASCPMTYYTCEFNMCEKARKGMAGNY